MNQLHTASTYADDCAKRMYEAEGRFLGLTQNEARAYVRAKLRELGAPQDEIDAIELAVLALLRDNARPADTPRGNANRMFR